MKKLIFALGLSLLFIGLQAQETTSASGGEASGVEGTVSYTVGQVTYNTHSGTTGSVSEGIQQPYEISVISGIEESGITLNVSAYPNPVIDHLILKIDDDSYSEQDRWIASVYDINGAVVKQQIIVVSETNIDMADLKAATYFLRIISDNQEVKTLLFRKFIDINSIV